MGNIITFYSYKGGVGRSMALANVALILSQWGYKVLAVDFDLEAPGLEKFFDRFLDKENSRKTPGVVDFLDNLCRFQGQNLSGAAPKTIPIRLPRTSGSLDLWLAGSHSKNYFRKVRSFDVPDFYSLHNGGVLIEELRFTIKQKYDYTLIDSRTGLTDFGGICTVQLPDLIVAVFSATNQSFEGVLEIIKRSSTARQRLPFPRPIVPVLPIPSRLDINAEYKLAQKWLNRFSQDLRDIFSSWLPQSVDPRALLDRLKLPHISYFSFGETLPVTEQGTNDPSGLGYAYENLAAAVARNLQDIELLIKNREEYIRSASHEIGDDLWVSKRPKIFISYHHADKKWLDRIRVHLSPIVQSRDLDVWDDTNLKDGDDWRREIDDAISESDVALLLVSADYLASQWISSEELPNLLRAANERGLRIIWVLLKPCLYEETSLAQYQAAVDPNRPLSILSKSGVERALVSIVKRISELAGRKY